MRADLLALSDDDLADISNRGNVKRATKELERNAFTVELTLNDASDLTALWSDDVTCVLKSDALLSEAHCTCPAPGVCRHIVRTILAYQRENKDAVPKSDSPWNPGDIRDDELKKHFTDRQRKQAEKIRKVGHVVELMISKKPTARFHRLGHNVRFMVPGDPRYVQCDCELDPPCLHAVLAVWAFRDMAEPRSEIIDTYDDKHDDQEDLADAMEVLTDIIDDGLANVPNTKMDRVAAIEGSLRKSGQLWHAEILSELRAQHDYYLKHDARFSPVALSNCVGEFIIRYDALRSPELPIPKLFVRGQVEAKQTSIGQARLVGLGCTAIKHAKGVELVAFLQDLSSGKLHALTTFFPDPPPDSEETPPSFSALARRLVVHGRDLATIGRSQLVLKSAKLTAGHKLKLVRGSASTYAQGFSWEELRAPVGIDGFDEIRARLKNLPPASLRPRRIGEDLHAVRVSGCREVQFSERDQTIRAILVDDDGETAKMIHPYTDRGAPGSERLLNWLKSNSQDLVFVSGTAKLGPTGLEITPVALIFETPDGRRMIQPSVDDMDEWLESREHKLEPPSRSGDAVDRIRAEFAALVGDAILLGPDERSRIKQSLDAVARRAANTSLTTVRDAAVHLSDSPSWSNAVLESAVVSKLAQELS